MRKITPDKEKATAMLKMSEKIEERIQDTEIGRFPSQVLTDYYDILHNLMEGISSADGFKSEGKGTHKKLIDWTTSENDLQENERQFLNQIRKYRNRISYEGFSIDSNFLERNQEKIQKLIEKLKTMLRKKI